MTRLADRSIEMVLRNRVYFGVGAIERLPEVVAAAGGSRVFVVTDPGVQRSGVIDRVLGVLAAAGVETGGLRRGRAEPRRLDRRARRGGAARLRPRRHGRRAGRRRLVDGHGQGARPAGDQRPPVWELEYDGPSLTPGPPDRRRADDRRDRRRDQQRSASSPTRRPGARATSAIRRCCRWRRSSTRR